MLTKRIAWIIFCLGQASVATGFAVLWPMVRSTSTRAVQPQAATSASVEHPTAAAVEARAGGVVGHSSRKNDLLFMS